MGKAARGGDLVPAHAPVVFSLDQPPDLSAAIQQFKRVAPEPRRYPYGNEPDPNRANVDDTKIEATSPAGCFPNGASVYGCQDMSGNVWEWMRSAYGPWQLKDDGVHVDLQFKYPYLMSDERESFEGDLQMARLLRGGSFIVRRRDARCACRRGDRPDLGVVNFGFRVVVSPSSL